MVFGDTAGSWRVKMCGMVFWMLIWKVQMKSPDSWFRKLHIKAVSHIFHIRWVLMQRGYIKSFHPALWPRSTLWTRRRWTPHPRKGLGDFDSQFSKQSLVFAANRNLEWNIFFLKVGAKFYCSVARKIPKFLSTLSRKPNRFEAPWKDSWWSWYDQQRKANGASRFQFWIDLVKKISFVCFKMFPIFFSSLCPSPMKRWGVMLHQRE